MSSTSTERPYQRNRALARTLLLCGILCVGLVVTSCNNSLPYHATGEVLHSYEHDPAAFTQCLVFDDGTLYESTGLYGESSLREVALESGEVVQIHRLPDHLFGEGCTVWEDTIVQVTWKAGVGFVYDKESFEVERQFTYPGEGWGLTHDGERLILSDGTSYLRFLDPETFEELDRVQVLDQGEPVDQLNELEWINGQVWANVWQTPDVVRIDPESGEVLGWIDFLELTEQQPRGVLNGIAKRGEEIFVTGKRWTAIYQVEIVAAEPTRTP